jgi:hypothetical protein
MSYFRISSKTRINYPLKANKRDTIEHRKCEISVGKKKEYLNKSQYFHTIFPISSIVLKKIGYDLHLSKIKAFSQFQPLLVPNVIPL